MLSMPDTLTKRRFYFPSSSIYSSGVRLRVVKGIIRTEPVISLGKKGEWDEQRVQLFGSVLFDDREKRFKMWYLGMPDGPESEERADSPGGRFYNFKQGYAESEDGLHWVKPPLYQAEWRGSKQNNLLNMPYAAPGAPYVIEDSGSGFPHQFKMILTHGGGGMLLFSDDGIHWEAHKDGKVLFTGGRHRGEESGFDYYIQIPYVFLRDHLTRDSNKRYRIYTQASSGPPAWIRRTGLIASPDAKEWTVHTEPVIGLPDGATGISGQIHGTAMTIYKGYYVAFIHYCLPQPKTGRFAPRVHLALSTDGENFRIFEDEDSALIPLGPDGSWSEGGLVSGCVLPVRDELWCYFSGLPIDRCWSGSEEKYGRPTINTGLARWPGERILEASLKPGFSKGHLMLDPFAVDAEGEPEILINANCENPQEDLKISLLDADTRLTIPGFSFDQFSLASEDGIYSRGRWTPAVRLRARTGVIPCIEIRGKSALLYGAEVVCKTWGNG